MENNTITEIVYLFNLFPKLRKFTNLTNKEYQTIWNTLALYIEDQLLIEKSPEVLGIGIFFTIRSWNERQRILIPQFYPSQKTFSKHPGFKKYKPLNEIKCKNRTNLNFTILSQMCKINREDFEMGLKDIQLYLLHAINKKYDLSLVFGKIGRLKIFPEYIKMKYSVSVLNKLKDAFCEAIEVDDDENNSNENINSNSTENDNKSKNKSELDNNKKIPNSTSKEAIDNSNIKVDQLNNRLIQNTKDLIEDENDKYIEALSMEINNEEFLPFDILNRKAYDKLSESEKKKAIKDLFESFDNYNVQQNNFLKSPMAFHGSENVFKPLIKHNHPFFLIRNNLKKLSHQNNIFPNININRSDPEIKKEEEYIKKAYEVVKPTTPHTHPYCGNRTWKSFNSCPICRQNKSVEINTRKNDEKLEKEFDMYLMKKAEKEKNKEEEYQKELELIRYKQAKEIAQFNKQIGEQKSRAKSPDKTCGSIFSKRPHVKNAILENQKYTKDLKEQIRLKEEEKKRLKMEQELENRLYNQKFLYEFSKDQAVQHLQKLNIQKQQRDSLLFQIEKNRLEKLEKEMEDNLMFKKCSENVFARDEQPLFELQKQKASELYRDQKLLERNKIMVNNLRKQKELKDDIDRLKFSQLLYKRDYNNEKREKYEIRKKLEEYWNEQIRNNDYNNRII